MSLEEVLEKWIPYRLQAVESLLFAWGLIDRNQEEEITKIVVNGSVVRAGNVAMVANPMIEAGAIHARALLEFLGLCVTRGRLAQLRNRKPSDVGIEHFSTLTESICKVTPWQAIATYAGPASEAEGSLVAVYELANKTLAHVTDGKLSQKWTDANVEIACRGIPILIFNNLYAKLGRDIPSPPEGRRVIRG